MATYSNNTTIKINGGMITTGALPNGLSTILSVPSDSYYELSAVNRNGGGTSLELWITTNAGDVIYNTTSTGLLNIKVGPGGLIKVNNFGPAGIYRYYLSGVLFTNTP